MTIILGIDPGSRVTGYGIVSYQKKTLRYLNCGVIKTAGVELAPKLAQIFDGISAQMREYQPSEVAVESVFMHKNAQSALKLGHARGAAMVAASIHCSDVYEYSARQIKQSVVGYGGAGKEQVQHMVRLLLNLSRSPQEDAADALAVAVCHAHMRESLTSLKQRVHT